MNKHITHNYIYHEGSTREDLRAFLEIAKLSFNQIVTISRKILSVSLACARVDLFFDHTYTRIRQEYSNPDLSSEVTSKVKFLKYDY